jgi:hypothetical protein
MRIVRYMHIKCNITLSNDVSAYGLGRGTFSYPSSFRWTNTRLLLTVDEHVPRRSRQLHAHPLHLLRQQDLAPEARRIRQTEGHVQHVVLVVARLLEEVIVLRREDDVACRACDGAFACT